MAPKKLILDYVYEKESAFADRVYLTQPVGGGKVIGFLSSRASSPWTFLFFLRGN